MGLTVSSVPMGIGVGLLLLPGRTPSFAAHCDATLPSLASTAAKTLTRLCCARLTRLPSGHLRCTVCIQALCSSTLGPFAAFPSTVPCGPVSPLHILEQQRKLGRRDLLPSGGCGCGFQGGRPQL
eukprot:915932-Pelagomonas_calceolata.AAC.1